MDDDLTRARTTEESGGGGGGAGGRTYVRDDKGSPTGGQFSAAPKGGSGSAKPTARPAAKKPAPKKRAAIPAPSTKWTADAMRKGGKNDPQNVRQLQALLRTLGLGNAGDTGTYDDNTEAAIKLAQQRLGLKPTGTASKALVNKMLTAYDLSPCVKRSAETDAAQQILRAAVAAGEFDDEDDLTNQGRLAVVRAGEIMRYQRFWPLDDIEISRAHADGRTVVAYATVFNTPYPVSDQYGDYEETVERTAFNNWLGQGGVSRAMCLYNHGFTIHGSPSDMYSVPLGQPLEIQPDGRGLKTVTRYSEGPDIDRVLEAIRNGAIRGQSFRGRIVRSSPNSRGRYLAGANGARTLVTRHELGLTDYGPTPMPVNAGAEILAVRSLAAQLGLSNDQLAEIIRNNTLTTPVDEIDEEPEADATTSDEEAGAEEPPVSRSEVEHSGRQEAITRRIRVAKLKRGMK